MERHTGTVLTVHSKCAKRQDRPRVVSLLFGVFGAMNENNKNSKKDNGSASLPIGMCIGLAVGTAIGAATHNTISVLKHGL